MDREQADEILDSLVNGQRKQAVRQMDALGMAEFPELLDYFTHNLDRPELAMDAAKSYFRIKANEQG